MKKNQWREISHERCFETAKNCFRFDMFGLPLVFKRDGSDKYERYPEPSLMTWQNSTKGGEMSPTDIEVLILCYLSPTTTHL